MKQIGGIVAGKPYTYFGKFFKKNSGQKWLNALMC
jgi:hypothetical protein